MLGEARKPTYCTEPIAEELADKMGNSEQKRKYVQYRMKAYSKL